MRRLLNTVYITSQGGYLFRDGENLVVKLDQQEKFRVPIHNLESVVCFGHVSVSSPILELCGERGVAVVFLTENGRFMARAYGRTSGNVLLRREQYRIADSLERSAEIARAILAGKVANARVILQRARRERDDGDGVVFDKPIGILNEINTRLERTNDLELLRGCEGDAARHYFGVFNELITAQKDQFAFQERNRRPPLDNVNALLSFVYTLLVHDVSAALESVGLDPAVGFLHRDRPGRPSLALDMMEELRPYIADRLVLTMINRQQVKANGFTKTESGAVMMDDATRKAVLVAYQERKRDEIQHPFLKEQIEVGLLPYAQALLLARHIRGDLDGYPPFFAK